MSQKSERKICAFHRLFVFKTSSQINPQLPVFVPRGILNPAFKCTASVARERAAANQLCNRALRWRSPVSLTMI